MSWLLLAIGSAFFAGITAILAKCGVQHVDSDLATALRTCVVLVFAWILVFLSGAQSGIGLIDARTLAFLVLSGLATGGSWLCYFRALQLGDVNQVTPIDKSSTVLTILLALIFLGEGLTLMKAVATALIGAGTLLMITKKPGAGASPSGRGWLFYAVLSAVFASLTAIFGKIGIEGLDATLGTAIRTAVVLVMAWMMVLVKGGHRAISGVARKDLLFLALSGLATGGSWLCFYWALQEGPASVVVPIDKLSILITIAFSWLVFGERLTRKAAAGLAGIAAGTILLACC